MSEFGSYVVSLVGVEKHPNADKLGIVRLHSPFEAQVIINLNDWAGEDKAVWILPDSVTGDHEAFDWYGRGKRVKTIKLRQLMSYGFFVKALPHHKVGDEVSKDFGVTKYEEPIKQGPSALKGGGSGDTAKGPSNAPTFTDIENVRNTKYSATAFTPGEPVILIEKLDGCVHEDTLVKTPHGEIKIKDIEPGLEILSYNIGVGLFEKDVVINKIFKKDNNAQWMRLSFDNGRQLVCTTNHPILTDRGYIAAVDITEKDHIIGY